MRTDEMREEMPESEVGLVDFDQVAADVRAKLGIEAREPAPEKETAAA